MWLLARKLQWIFGVKTCYSHLFCIFSLRSHDTSCNRDIEYITEMKNVSFLGGLVVILKTVLKLLFQPSSMSLIVCELVHLQELRAVLQVILTGLQSA